MNKILYILVAVLAFAFLGAKAQSVPRELSPETRACISCQLENLKKWYPVKTARKNVAPPVAHFPYSGAEMKSMLASKKSDFPLVSEDLVLDILDFYLTEHFDDCKYLLAMAELQEVNSKNVFSEKELPLNIMYLALAKSAMNPEYSTSAGALGTWQFMYSTGRLYHLRIDEFVDERKEIKRSSEAAAWMLKDLYNLYHDWPLAISAYSCGPGNVNKALRKCDSVKSFAEAYKYLPSPERDLYPSFLALNVIIENSVKFGIEPALINYPLTVDTVFVADKLHFGQVAEVVGVDENLLCQLNPVYSKKIIPGNTDYPLSLVLPDGVAVDYYRLKDSIFTYKDSLYFNIEPVKKKEEQKAIPDPYTPGKGFVPVDYTIKSGDNLGYISSWFDTNINEIRFWNGIHGNSIRAGQKLVVYVPKAKEAYYSAVNKLTFQQKQAREGKLVTSEKKAKPAQEILKSGEYVVYIVKSGDNPWQIAKKYPGVSDQDILRWNSIDPKGLHVGQKLKIKKMGVK